ncbi:RNA-binding domain-containing protein [Irpex rosettiformis]|uniref:RNA-binding domain-containing protein n=1 Tax=Irpex rosettiformis TaxID=378272 RepID=A0ACB8UHL5_9APHY|nr:RNA-binding domain-containing protein [Irpex rosettiformis]
MEEGTKTKKTVFVGNIADNVDESVLLDTFSAFGDVIEVQIPPATTDPNRQTEEKHKGYGFVTFSSSADAQDAIDNMDLNELQGKVIRVNLARPTKIPVQGMGNRAVWETEEWLKQHVKPLAHSGGAALRGQPGASAEAAGDAEHADVEEEGNAMEE